MQCQRVTLVEAEAFREVEVALDILGIGDVDERVLAFAVLGRAEEVRDAVEQVARCLHAAAHGVGVGAIVQRGGIEQLRAVGEAVAPLHDEEVFIDVAQDGIAAGGVVEVEFAELGADPGHEDVVQVEQVHTVLASSSASRPAIAPRAGEHTTVKLGTVLQVEHQAHLARGLGCMPELFGEKRELEVRKREPYLGTIFDIVLIHVSAQALDCLEGSAQLHAESLRTAEHVTVQV